VTPLQTRVFDLPERLAAKADPALISEDEEHLVAVAATMQAAIAEANERLAALRRAPGVKGQGALDRDLEIHRVTGRVRTLARFGLDACLGRLVYADASEPVYIGRLGLSDSEGRRLLLDWRSPAAEPYFAATHARPMGLMSRRRYRWTRGRITDYWDEAFTSDALASETSLDDQSAFIASLAGSRSDRMRDVLGTIQADQDAIIRAGSRGTLVIDGGPGTGKTVVALHRAAYLLYADPRLRGNRGGVLFVGPHEPYLAYVSDVLPGLGEDGVQIRTLRDLVPGGAQLAAEPDAEVARLKCSGRLVAAVDAAVDGYERPPTRVVVVDTDWFELEVEPADWEEAFAVADGTLPHNLAREEIWEALLDLLVDKLDAEALDADQRLLRRMLAQHDGLRRAFSSAWPLLDPQGVIADLWSVPSYLRRCAPWLTAAEASALHRTEGRAWTISDLPYLDAARLRIGDPEEPTRRRRNEQRLRLQRELRSDVIHDLIAADATSDDGVGLVTMLRQEDAQSSLVDEAELSHADPDLLAGPFAHIIVDEAQELSDAEWQMLLVRCPSRSFTIVGDRAQARQGFAESWAERLERVGLGRIELAPLTVNYRTPEEVMAEAAPVILAAIPDANVPTSVRRSGVSVGRGDVSELGRILDEWLSEHERGTVCVIGHPDVELRPRVRALTPESAKGLEFDLVVLVDPDRFGAGIEGAVDRYVAMTRATQRLVVLTTGAADW